MKRKLVNTLWAMGLLTVASLCLPACNRELEVQQAYDFTLETMPVQKDLRRGETAEIRCTLKRAGRFAGARYICFNVRSHGSFAPICLPLPRYFKYSFLARTFLWILELMNILNRFVQVR